MTFNQLTIPKNSKYSCIEALDLEENLCKLYCEDEATHCGVFEWEGLFYTRYESFTKRFFTVKFLYKIFGVGKIVSLPY